MDGSFSLKRSRPLHLLAVALTALMALQGAGRAQGLVQGVEQGAKAGNKAAGPVGGVLGGAIGGVVGVVGGVLGVPPTPARPADRAKSKSAREQAREQGKSAKAPKAARAQPPAPPPELTAEQIVAQSDANIARIKAELKLTPEQEKHWPAFNSAMHDLGNHGAERLNLRNARARRDPPDDIVEQMRNEAQFLVDRAQDQRSVADAADPLFASLDEKQKAIFIEEMVRLSRERGLD